MLSPSAAGVFCFFAGALSEKTSLNRLKIPQKATRHPASSEEQASLPLYKAVVFSPPFQSFPTFLHTKKPANPHG